jgi:hypothetical protein
MRRQTERESGTGGNIRNVNVQLHAFRWRRSVRQGRRPFGRRAVTNGGGLRRRTRHTLLGKVAVSEGEARALYLARHGTSNYLLEVVLAIFQGLGENDDEGDDADDDQDEEGDKDGRDGGEEEERRRARGGGT